MKQKITLKQLSELTPQQRVNGWVQVSKQIEDLTKTLKQIESVHAVDLKQRGHKSEKMENGMVNISTTNRLDVKNLTAENKEIVGKYTEETVKYVLNQKLLKEKHPELAEKYNIEKTTFKYTPNKN